MKIRALRPQKGTYGFVSRRQVIDVPEGKAKALIATGNWIPVAPEEKKAPAPKNKMAPEVANKADRPTGGQRGKAKQSPSSQAGQASKASPSKNSEGAAE